MIAFLTAIGAYKYIAGLFVFLSAFFMIRKGGEDAAKKKDMERQLDSIAEAHRAVDAVRRDDAERNRVRERFTRK